MPSVKSNILSLVVQSVHSRPVVQEDSFSLVRLRVKPNTVNNSIFIRWNTFLNKFSHRDAFVGLVLGSISFSVSC